MIFPFTSLMNGEILDVVCKVGTMVMLLLLNFLLSWGSRKVQVWGLKLHKYFIERAVTQLLCTFVPPSVLFSLHTNEIMGYVLLLPVPFPPNLPPPKVCEKEQESLKSKTTNQYVYVIGLHLTRVNILVQPWTSYPSLPTVLLKAGWKGSPTGDTALVV